MGERKNHTVLSVLCLVQLILAAVVLCGILIFRSLGGDAWESARNWYSSEAEDTIMVYPAEVSSEVSDA